MNDKLKNLNIEPLTDEQIESASRKQLIKLLRGEQKLRRVFQEVAEENIARAEEMREKITLIDGLFYKIRSLLFRKKSERSGFRGRRSGKNKKTREEKAPAPKLPSERYPARSLKRAFKWFKDNW